GARGDAGEEHRKAVRQEPSGGSQASQGAGAGGADRRWPRRTVAPLPAASRAAQGGRPLDRALPPVLGEEPRPARRLSARIAGKGRQTRPQEIAARAGFNSSVKRE